MARATRPSIATAQPMRDEPETAMAPTGAPDGEALGEQIVRTSDGIQSLEDDMGGGEEAEAESSIHGSQQAGRALLRSVMTLGTTSNDSCEDGGLHIADID